MQKQIIIINGQGGVGKDTICNIVSGHYKTKIISSIDIIKTIASFGGWDGQKDLKGRKLLSDIKLAFSEYNNLPYKKIVDEIKDFLDSNDYQILFIHIREPVEIKKMVMKYPQIKTLLIKRNGDYLKYGNIADDNVGNYTYNFIFENNGELVDLENDFMLFFEKFILRKDVC